MANKLGSKLGPREGAIPREHVQIIDGSEMDTRYNPKQVDKQRYLFWEEGGFFTADPRSDKPPYCIVMPPPNVTGVLHMGHALVSTLQDILIRWKRMSGFEVLWVPGTDHAGIATQTVVERRLIETTGKRRKDFSREEFTSHVWAWKEEKERRITQQLRALGCSCDWSRYSFTMDEQRSRAVRTMFKKMFHDGLIYRGDYLVNWDPATQTALADDEVEYIDRDGKIWTISYPLADGTGHIKIATTRPETLLGDTAVAVHPDDKRYHHLIGKEVRLPLSGRAVPIIADHYVDPEFGTGAVKITPAHDPNDYNIGLNHELQMINILTTDGHLNQNGLHFQGLTVEEAREAVVAELKRGGLLADVKPHQNRVGLSYRSKAVIEPMLSEQWFVRMSDFRGVLREAVTSGRLKIVPKSWESTWFHWIDNLRDWCISRQLWWGHRIPIWYRKGDPAQMLCYDGKGVPPEVAAHPEEWQQDPDCLDTWFSSGLWPYSTLGWPDKTPELARFYPNSILVTGHDILFFWVARMALMGHYGMGELPFPETLIHGLIYGRSYWRKDPEGGINYVTGQERTDYDLGKPLPKDVHSKWEKLSKSKGNVIDPLEIIDEYGTDAMRMALCASGPQNMQIDLDRRRLAEFKNFANKIWNGARFVLLNVDDLAKEVFAEGLDETQLTLEDRWILSALQRRTREVGRSLGAYGFEHAAKGSYDFFWKEFCAYYVEAVKPVLFGKAGDEGLRANKQKLLLIVLCQAVRMLHPIAPFITEELFQLLKKRIAIAVSEKADPYTQECLKALAQPACLVAPYPTAVRETDISDGVEAEFDLLQRIIYTVRNIRGEMQLNPGTATDLHIVGPKGSTSLELAKRHQHLIPALVRAKALNFANAEPDLGFASTGVVGELKILVPFPEEIREQEQKRLEKERVKIEQNAERTRKQLANQAFVDKAPPELVEKARATLHQLEAELAEVRSKLAQFGS